MNAKLKYWLRWLGVLPISFLAGILVDLPLHWILYSTLSGGDSPFITPYPEFPERLLAPFVRAMTVVWVSSQIAPDNKNRTAIFFTTLWILFSTTILIMGCLRIQIYNHQFEINISSIPVIMGLIGALVGLYIVYKTGEPVSIEDEKAG